MKTVSVPQGALKSYDFVVVGAGSAGCALAARLSECKDVTVCLIEAGEECVSMDAKVPLACGNLQKTEVDYQYWSEKCDGAFQGLANFSSYWPRGKGLGGSSLINYMAYVRGSREDYDNWERMGATGWSYEGVLPFFKKAEGCASIGNKFIDPEVHGTTGPLTTTVMDPPRTLSTKFLEAAESLGFKLGDYNAGDMHNVAALFAHTIRNGSRCDTATAYLASAPQRENLTIVTKGQAAALLWNKEKTKILGVSVINSDSLEENHNQRKVNIWAKREVIVSCGALDTPKLLMLSGIGPNEHLNSLGIECVRDLEVGHHLEDHIANIISFPVNGCDSVSGQRAEGFPNAIFNIASWALFGTGILCTSAYDATLFYKTPEFHETNPDYGPDIQIGIFVTPGNDKIWADNLGFAPNFLKGTYEPHMEGYVLVPTLLHPYSKGKIELRDRNPLSPPRIISNYLTDERDVKAAAKSYLKCLELSRSGGLGEVSGEPNLPADLVEQFGGYESMEFWEEYARRTGTTLYHPTSSAKIGVVVDEHLRVYNVEGLRIADASICPTVISGNTNAPSIMIGEKAADMIKEDHGLTSHVLTIGPDLSQSNSRFAYLAAAIALTTGMALSARKSRL